MAVSFSSVKAIAIPEGDVKQITNSSGTVLWKKVTIGTLTIGLYFENYGQTSSGQGILKWTVSGEGATEHNFLIQVTYATMDKTSTYASYTYSTKSLTINTNKASSGSGVYLVGSTYGNYYCASSYPTKIGSITVSDESGVKWTISPTSVTSKYVSTWLYFTATPK